MTCTYPQHDLCKYRRDCKLRYGNKFTSQLSKDIAHYQRVLQDLYHQAVLYWQTADEIKQGIYKGKRNVMGNPIISPEDVYYNLNIKLIEKNIEVTKNTINELTKEENKVIKTLKRSERRKRTYGI